MSLANEPPILPDMFEALKQMKSRFSSRREYESTVKLMWSGVPELIARERVEGGEVEEKTVYAFDPLSMVVHRSEPILLWEKILLPVEDKLDTVLARGYNFLFYGANGSGKTHSAVQILCSAIELGHSGYYITLRDLYLLYNEVNFKEHTPDQSALLDFISKADVLVLDEVGKESLTGPVVSFIEDLLKARSTRPCTTFICSNIQIHKKEFLTRYGNSVWDIVRGCYFVYHFASSGDYRSKFRKTLDL